MSSIRRRKNLLSLSGNPPPLGNGVVNHAWSLLCILGWGAGAAFFTKKVPPRKKVSPVCAENGRALFSKRPSRRKDPDSFLGVVRCFF